MHFLLRLGSFQSGIDDDYNIELFNQGMQSFARFGYTTAQEGRAFDSTVMVAAARASLGPLPIDVALYVDYTAKNKLPDSPYYTGNGYQGIGYDNGLRIAGLKLTLDGSPPRLKRLG